MGVQLGEIIDAKEIELNELSGKIIAIDALNSLYQFLSIIRQRDGTPLMDSEGRITSHLSGLFYRTANLLKEGIKPVYVFDGEPPELKKKTIEKRKETREEAERKWKEALKRGDLEAARRYAQAAVRLEEELISDAKRLLEAMGVPYVQAPSEGEAQAAYMASKGDVWAAGSQDYDSLLFGASRLVRNLTITGKRKLPKKEVYVEIKPEIIELSEVLKKLNITREQLVYVGILVGTDYNPGGVKGIGPKRAYEIVRQYRDLDKIKKVVNWTFDVEPEEIAEIFLKPKVTDEYKIEFRKVDTDAVIEFLCEERDFSRDRVEKTCKEIEKAHIQGRQASLAQWFG